MLSVERRAPQGRSAGRRGALAAALLRLAAGTHAPVEGRGGGAGRAAATAPSAAPGAAEPPRLRLREALLREARERLTTWYQDKDTLELPFWRDGAQVQVSKAECRCDGPGGDSKVPLTFGEFEVEGARPVDVFNVLADSHNQTKWDPTVTQVEEVFGEWPQTDGVRALEMVYPTGIFLVPPREVFEWVAYSANFQRQEFWVVYSTLDNGRLHEARPRAAKTVPAQNCLGGYWIRPRPGGGSRVLFTQHVNPHPPLMLPAKLVFSVSWGKQIDYINILRQKSREQSVFGWAENRTVIAEELLHEPSAVERSGASHASADAHFDFRDTHAGFFRLYKDERSPILGAAWTAPAPAAAAFCAAALLAVGAALAVGSRRRRMPARRAVKAAAQGAAGGAAEAASLLEEPSADEGTQV